MTGTDLMTIREMCDAFDVTPRTLRFYEAKELIQPIREGTRRLYTRRERARLKLILRGKHFGFSLEDIRRTLDLYDPSQKNLPQIVQTCNLARDRVADMLAERAKLDAAIAELQAEIAHGEMVIARLRTAPGS